MDKAINPNPTYSEKRRWALESQLCHLPAIRLVLTVCSLLALLFPFAQSESGRASAQTKPPSIADQLGGDPGAGALSSGARTTEGTARLFPDEPRTNDVLEWAEQNKNTALQEVEAMLTDNFRSYNDVYMGLHTFWGDDVVSNFFANIGQVIGKWLTEFINGWVADTVQFLTGFLRIFVLNPNVAVNGLSEVPGAGPADDISPFIRQGADIMYGIAVDLLLLLFILCIWKYWAEAAWRGGGNLMGAVGRMIFTAGLMLAWPTIYAFEIQITNEMIKALYFNSADQVAALDAAMAAAVKGGLLAGAGLLANATAPIAGQVFGGLLGAGPGGIALGTVGSLISFAGLIIYLILGGILIAELIYILVLKAIQTALLTAQYMFAPVFLVFFATPDTESVTAGFVRSFVEVSLWTFVWVGLLKILVIMVLSDFNPWGKIILAVGILQMMIQVPSFLARAQISPMSDFVSAGLITGGLLSGGKALSNVLSSRSMQMAEAIGGKFTTGAARGMDPRKAESLDAVAGPRDPKLLTDIRSAARGEIGEKKLNVQDGKKPGDPGSGGPGTGKTPAGFGPNSGAPGGLQPPGKKAGDGVPGTGNNPATDASLAGKKPNMGTAAADSANKMARNAGLGAAVGLGSAALAGAQARGVGSAAGQDAGSQDARNAKAAAEQADLQAKQMSNMVNAGLVEPGDGKGSGKEGDKALDPKLAKGAELNQNTGNKNEPGKLGDPAAGAQAGGGLVPPGAKAKGENAKDNAAVTPVDKAVKPAGDATGKTGSPFGPPGAKELEKMANQTGDATGAKPGATSNPDGKPIVVESEEDATAAAVAAGLNLAPGARLGGGAATGTGTGTGAGTGGDQAKIGMPGNKPGANAADTAAGKPVDLAPAPPGAKNLHPVAKHADATTSQLANQTSSPANMKSPDPLAVLNNADGNESPVIGPGDPGLPKPLVGTPVKNQEGVELAGMAPGASPTGAGAQTTVKGQRVAGPAPAAGPGVQQTVLETDGAAAPNAGTPGAVRTAYAGGAPPPPGSGGNGGDMAPPPPGGGGPEGLPAHGQLPESTYLERLNQTQAVDPYKNYQQAGYRWIPPRGIAGAIRLAQNVTLGPSGHAGAELIGDGKGATYHVRTGEGMSNEQVALQMMTAGYATHVGNDPHAFAAARQAAIDTGADGPQTAAQRIAAGIFSYHGGSWSQTANAKQNFQHAMYSQAIQGSQAYVNGQSGNAYTEYLNDRYGPMSAEQQAFGVHMMTDTSSPESSWHWAHIPATETLVRNSIPISATSRAFAANPNVFRARPWEQRTSIAGGVQYMEARKAQELPEGTHPMIADAWVGREAQLLSPAVVNTLGALTSELGEDVCADVATVNNVSNIVGAGQDQRAYVDAYRALKNVQSVGNSYANRPAGPAAPPSPGSMGPRPMGPGPGGGMGPVGGGNWVGPTGGAPGSGGSVDHMVDVQQNADPGYGSSTIPPAALTPPPMPGLAPPVQTNINFRAVPGAAGGGTQQSHSVRMPMPASSQGTPQVRETTGNFSGATGGPIVNEQQVELQFQGRGSSNQPPPFDPNKINIPNLGGQKEETVLRVDGRVIGAGSSVPPAPQNVSVESPLRDAHPHQTVQMGSFSEPSRNNQTVTQNVSAEIMHQRGGSSLGSADPNSIHRDVQQMLSSYNNDTAQMAYHVVYDLHSKGFSFEQLSNKSVAATAMQIHAQDPSMVKAAAITANALSTTPQEFTVERTHTVQAMMDADPKWNSNNIDDESIYAAEAIMRVHSSFKEELTNGGAMDHPINNIKPYPTKDFVDRVAIHPEFSPRATSGVGDYSPSVISSIKERLLDRIRGEDPNYGGMYDQGSRRRGAV